MKSPLKSKRIQNIPVKTIETLGVLNLLFFPKALGSNPAVERDDAIIGVSKEIAMAIPPMAISIEAKITLYPICPKILLKTSAVGRVALARLFPKTPMQILVTKK